MDRIPIPAPAADALRELLQQRLDAEQQLKNYMHALRSMGEVPDSYRLDLDGAAFVAPEDKATTEAGPA